MASICLATLAATISPFLQARTRLGSLLLLFYGRAVFCDVVLAFREALSRGRTSFAECTRVESLRLGGRNLLYLGRHFPGDVFGYGILTVRERLAFTVASRQISQCAPLNLNQTLAYSCQELSLTYN
jgi:hypothetical protein